MTPPNWDIFRAKFKGRDQQDQFEWLCYLLFCKEFNKPLGISRYKNQTGIETNPIIQGNEIIGFQAKFYGSTLSEHKSDWMETIEKSKKCYPNITKLIFYTNQEWGQGRKDNKSKAQEEVEDKAEQSSIQIEWRCKSYFETGFVCVENENISKYFFSFEQSTIDSIETQTQLFGVSFFNHDDFIGRETELDELDNLLKTHHTVKLTGIGGAGKTRLALHYAHEQHKQYPSLNIFLISALNKSSFEEDLRQLAVKLKANSNLDTRQKIAFIKNWLENNTQWLMILDNADDSQEITVKLLESVLPASSTSEGRVLLTTQISTEGAFRSRYSVPVKCLSDEQGAKFLLNRMQVNRWDSATTEEKSEAAEISRKLGGLPLALAQAAAYLTEAHCALNEYLPLYEKHAKELLRHDHSSLISDHAPVFTTFQLLFTRLPDESKELLNFCALLATNAIPLELLPKAFTIKPFVLNERLKPIYKYDLMQKNTENETLALHGVVQRILLSEMNNETKCKFVKQAVLAINELLPNLKFDKWPIYGRFLQSGLACATWIIDNKWCVIENEQAGLLLHQLAMYLRTAKTDDIKAESLLNQSLKIREKVLGKNHLDTAKSLNSLGVLYKEQGKYKEAENCYKDSLQIRTDIAEKNSLIVAKSLNNLALLYQRQCQYVAAEWHYEKSLKIRENLLEKNDPDAIAAIALALNTFGEFYEILGNYEQAEDYYKRSLEIREKKYGQDHPTTIATASNLGNLYRILGKYKESEELLDRCLKVREEKLEPDSPKFALSLARLGLLYKAQGSYEKAEPYLKRNLSIRQKISEEQGSRIVLEARAYRYLADLYYIQCKYEEAEKNYNESLTITEKLFEQEHIDKASCLNGLANVYRVQGKYQEAEDNYIESYTIHQNLLGENHYYVGESLYGLAELYRAMAKYEQAEENYKKSLSIYEGALGQNHPDTQKVRDRYDAFKNN